MALLYNIVRTATLKCCKAGRVWAMTTRQFKEVRNFITTLSKKRLEENQKLLESIPIFRRLRKTELVNLTQACHEIKFKSGETLLDKDEKFNTDDMFIIKEGEAWMIRDRRSSIAICSKDKITAGDMFMQGMTEDDTLKSVKASGHLKCMKINRDDFNTLVAPALNMSKQNSDDEDARETVNDESLPAKVEKRV